MSGDGAETEEDGSPIPMSRRWLPPQIREKTWRLRRSLSQSFTSHLSYDDLHIKSCAENMSSSMIGMIHNAKETRQLIREISLDSEEKELIIDEIAFAANEAEIEEISLNTSFDTHMEEDIWSLANHLADPSDCNTMLKTRKASLSCESLYGNLPSNDGNSFTDESSSDLYEWVNGWTKEGFLEGKNIRETECQPPSGWSSVHSESILERLQDFSDGLSMANLSV